ncbi:V12 [Sputnik virophage]|uniref:Uncharacterized protein V12 n=4 Tax=Mimivirus-dependent virus Sputnik TaxID=1932927 RepID=VF546_SPTNK|nr:V12 [Sputnik virophage]B4YNF2.1 RecName: Full=Uncharacterized protein V12 [Sputnik virophage]AUG84999.1 hypothetical protein [Sputnik virophage 2]UMZ08524.1 hypothetical protein [Mimivirus-dependent virus Sputnik]VAV82194.1 hypothetical protein GUARANI_15 [Guarani virophage]ACF16996.1 V12 [Sputnik virophage]
MSNMYCGIGKVPKGKERGTPEHCFQSNQIRYYGIKKIDKSLLEKPKKKRLSLIKEQTKLNNLLEKGKRMVKEANKLKSIINDPESSKTEIRNAKKKLEKIVAKKNKFVLELKQQRQVVDELLEEEREKEKAERKAEKAKKNKKKSSTKTKKK